LFEFAFGAAINAELIIIAATRTTAVLLMSLAFMTAPALSPLSTIASAFGNTQGNSDARRLATGRASTGNN